MIAQENKIEIRKLTREEAYRLFSESSSAEVDGILRLCSDIDIDPFDFIETFSHEYLGFVEDGRPVYIAAIMKDVDGSYDFRTVANTNIKNMISLCKHSKRILDGWIQKYGQIHAYMPRGNDESIKWTEWLGFKRVYEDDKVIHYIKGENHGLR